jgi:hypothetical protein
MRGWKQDSYRHALASKGIKSSIRSIPNKYFVGKEEYDVVLDNVRRWEDLDRFAGYPAYVGENAIGSTVTIDLRKYEKKDDGKYHLKNEYLPSKIN